MRAKPYANDLKPVSDIDILLAKIGSQWLAGGTLKAFFGAKDTHVLSTALLNSPSLQSEPDNHKVCFTAFTFNEDEKDGPLIKALGVAARAVSVRMFMDASQSLRGKTKRQA